jgi:probable rRNA maturation factor
MIELDLQQQLSDVEQLSLGVPAQAQIESWVERVLLPEHDEAQLTIRIVGEDEIQQLNRDYRDKNRPTNVLSFPFEAPPGVELPLLGDIVIAAAVVAAEAETQNKSLESHWAHMVIHGVLHLLGYDHVEHTEAETMETLEIEYLARLKISNPYELDEQSNQ